MAGDPNRPKSGPSSGGGTGCLVGAAITFAVPVVVFCAILVANSLNPQCGTPADEGGCEMGLASGTIGAIVIGLVAGLAVWLILARMNRKP